MKLINVIEEKLNISKVDTKGILVCYQIPHDGELVIYGCENKADVMRLLSKYGDEDVLFVKLLQKHNDVIKLCEELDDDSLLDELVYSEHVPEFNDTADTKEALYVAFEDISPYMKLQNMIEEELSRCHVDKQPILLYYQMPHDGELVISYCEGKADVLKELSKYMDEKVILIHLLRNSCDVKQLGNELYTKDFDKNELFDCFDYNDDELIVLEPTGTVESPTPIETLYVAFENLKP